MTNIDIREYLSTEQLIIESLKVIGRRDDSPFGNLFPSEKPVLK
jgi:hypothetical protein